MLKFIFGGRKEPQVKVETQRETFERLVTELNGAIDALPEKPRVTIDPATGHILPEPPDQFPDEALALPHPSAADTSSDAPEPSASEAGPADGPQPEAGAAVPPDPSTAAETVADKITMGDSPSRTAPERRVLPGTPMPNPPRPQSSAGSGADPG